jgi:hypothetical protein
MAVTKRSDSPRYAALSDEDFAALKENHRQASAANKARKKAEDAVKKIAAKLAALEKLKATPARQERVNDLLRRSRDASLALGEAGEKGQALFHAARAILDRYPR